MRGASEGDLGSLSKVDGQTSEFTYTISDSILSDYCAHSLIVGRDRDFYSASARESSSDPITQSQGWSDESL
jgi:hypothetical protein